MKYCKHCGAQIEDTVAFCPNCGTDVSESTVNNGASEPIVEPAPQYNAYQPEQPQNTAQYQPYQAYNSVVNQQNGSSNGFSIAGLVLGIVACVFFWFSFINTIALILGIVGIILAIMGSKKAKATGGPTGIATAGLVLSIIGTVLAGIGFLTCTVCICITADGLYSLDHYIYY